MADCLGSSQIWKHSSIVFIWPQSYYMERDEWTMGEVLWVCQPRFVCEFCLLGPSWLWLNPCLWKFWWIDLHSFCHRCRRMGGKEDQQCPHCMIIIIKTFYIFSRISIALQIGCNAVSWAPAIGPNAAFDSSSGVRSAPVKRFVSGGCDNLVKVWRLVSLS